MNDFINALNWRYAAKRMNGKPVPAEKVSRILDAIRLSASSMGLQPYTILTIENEELRKKLRTAAYNQPQVTEGSYLIVFAAWDGITEEQIDEYIHHTAEVRNISPESLADFRSSLVKNIVGQSPDEQFEWAARQVYIALGTGLAAAAVERVDATPMEGFNPEEVDRILNLTEMGLKSVSLMALGYRDEENDFLANAKKVRREKEKLILPLN